LAGPAMRKAPLAKPEERCTLAEGKEEGSPAALPTGTVTFLLADLDDAVPGARRQALGSEPSEPGAWRLAPGACWREWLRREFDPHDGPGVRATEGVLLVASQRASDALAAAIAWRRAGARPGSLEPPRMALHTGEIESGADPYRGPALDHLLRLFRAV